MIMSKILTRKLIIAALLLSASFASMAGGDWIYTVKKGDTLWSLAEDFMVDVRHWRKLQQMNQISDTTLIPPGTKLHIPLKWTKINPSNAHVTNVSGKVFVTVVSTGKRKKLSSRMKLKSGDKIVTAVGGSTTLTFGDGSVLILRENSELILDTLEFYGNEDVFNSELKLHRGQTDNKVNPWKKPGSRFEIHTPSATAAVRGTTYRVTAPNQTSTTTEVLEGKVNLANGFGQTQVPSGYGTTAKKGQAPSAPVALLPAPDLAEVSKLIEQLPLRFELPEIEKAQAYRIQIATDPSFESLVYNGVSDTPSAKIAELADGQYLMKVRGIDQNELEGFDGIHSFVLNAKPEAPFLMQPQHESVVPVGDHKFSWSQSEGISSYHFQLADNVEFSKPLIDRTNNQGAKLELTDPLQPGHWFWRVAANDPAEGAGPFGEVNLFRVVQPGPEVESADLSDSDIVFRWFASAEEGEQYQIQVARDDTFTALMVDELTSESSYRMSRPEKSGKIYMRTRLVEPDGLAGLWGRPQMLEIPDQQSAWKAVLPLLLIFL